jgi:predicted ribosome quality control (RQC) complex YloA/Tae2 family protein
MKLKKFEEFEQLNEEYKLSKVVKKDEKDGYQILIGRNAQMNDVLTTEIAEPNDIWLHASGVPGSHLVIKNPDNEEVPMDVVRYAAELAGKNSKGTGKVKVVWTKAKNVTKNSKHNIGQVSVDYDKSKFININI